MNLDERVARAVAPATTQPRREPRRALDLLARTFPPPAFAVPGLVPEGLSLLVGAPKVGKSWLSLGIAIAVASGGRALGSIEVEQGDVLYLAAEDGERRLQDRLRRQLAGDPCPDGLFYETDVPRLDEGLTELIEAWCRRVDRPRLVIVDVLARVRPVVESRSAYTADYLAVGQLQSLAVSHGLAMVVVHHTRKAAADDWVDAASGTRGLSGAADTILTLTRERSSADAVLKVVSRDIEEDELALQFDREVANWRIMGSASEAAQSAQRLHVLRALDERGTLTPKELSDLTGIPRPNLRQLVRRMEADDLLQSDGNGGYRRYVRVTDVTDVTAPVTPVMPVTSPAMPV